MHQQQLSHAASSQSDFLLLFIFAAFVACNAEWESLHVNRNALIRNDDEIESKKAKVCSVAGTP